MQIRVWLSAHKFIKILKCRLAESGPGNQFPGPEWATFSDPQSANIGSFPGPESTNPAQVTLSNSEQTTQLGGKSVEYKLQLYEDSYHVQEYL